jgi:WD40 repeat protein
MKKTAFRHLVVLAAGLVFTIGLSAQTRNSSSAVTGAEPAGSHRGEVTAMLLDSRNRILSAGEDGFLEIWDPGANAAVDRFQLSPYKITSMALRPGKPQIAVTESDGAGLYRLSAWDYGQKKKLFTLMFRDTLTCVNYSAAGSFLITALSGGTGVSLIEPETGRILKSLETLSGQAVLAATGRSERSMICYLLPGTLSYWDLETGSEMQGFNVPSNISSPLLLGNNRFLAGFDASGLLVLDAVSGSVIIRNGSLRRGALFTGNPESTEFICFVSNEQVSGSAENTTLYHFYVNGSGELETRNSRTVPARFPRITAGTVISNDSAALGTAAGGVLVFTQNGNARAMNTRNQVRVIEAASSSEAIGFITEDSRLGFIPLDYNRFDSGNTLILRDSGAYTRLSSDSGTAAGFLFWQPDNTRSFPFIKTLSGRPESGDGEETFIPAVSFRFPLRAVSVFGDRCLFLDSVGNLSVTVQQTGELIFTFTSSGAQDADFIDESNILIGRSAGTGNTAFLKINIETGETVPLAYAAAVGDQVYRGGSGAVYGAAINRDGTNYKTSVVGLDTSNSARSKVLLDYSGEDTQFSMAESGDALAASLGGDEAAIYRITGTAGTQVLERTSGLPVRILGGDRWFVVLDADGNIAWHDPRTGKILALLKLYENEWVLESGAKTVRGKIGG